MRKKYLVGNWKMNKNLEEARILINEIDDSESIEVIIAPSFIYLKDIGELTTSMHIHVAAQNMHYADQGAFSGEVSPQMLLDIGCHNVIIGHSERRYVFGEDDYLINQKLMAACNNEMYVTFCVSETGIIRDEGNYKEFIGNQINIGLDNIENIDRVAIAYEPLWGISTTDKQRDPTNEEIGEVINFIRNKINEMYGRERSENISILYGGNVKPSNAKRLISIDNLDGFVVGGASLNSEKFNAILEIMEENLKNV